jgi:thiol-disulfide isomerase/thioredoxin
MTRDTLGKKALKELQKATGDSFGGKRIALVLASLTAFVILAIVGSALLSTAGNDGTFTPNARGLLPVGSQAPDFTAQTVDGGCVSLGDAGGKEATMLVFFASWCPHCNKEAPIISDLESEYGNLRVVMIGIDGQDDSEKVQEFVNRYSIEGPATYDPSLGPTYQVSGYPTIYVLDSNNDIVAAHSGEAPKDVLEGWIEEALGSSGG